MDIIKTMEKFDHEQIIFSRDNKTGLKVIVAIHNTNLGPALGGTRMWPYKSEQEAIIDALRLSEGMTYKNAGAGVDYGGGKAVIIGDPKKDKTQEMFLAFGRIIERLNGRFITASDVGTNMNDLSVIHEETNYVTGYSKTGSSGNSSPITAFGVYKGMKAAAKHTFGNESLKGKTIAVQGVGGVAYALCELLAKEGANLVVTDVNRDAVDAAVKDFGAKAVEPDEIYSVDCDVFSPCALGGIINDETLPQFKAKIIAGSANNQLKEEKHGDALYEKGILHAPDFIISAGGVLNAVDGLKGEYNKQRALKSVENIYNNLMKVFKIAKDSKVSTSIAAERMVTEQIYGETYKVNS